VSGCLQTGDHGVAIASTAFPDYTRAKYGDKGPRLETYVVMQGSYHPGPVVDRSLERLEFRRLMEMVAPDLASQRFLPAQDVKSADLLLVVHWGVTAPTERLDKLFSRDPPSLANVSGKDANTGVDYHPHTVDTANEQSSVSDAMVEDFFSNIPGEDAMAVAFQESELLTEEMGARYARGNAATLLGYGRFLRQTENNVHLSVEEAVLRHDLDTPRYFVIIQAFALKELKDRKPRLVWTLHLNMASNGNNFREAVVFMGDAAINFFGRTTDRVDTVLPREREGTVTIGDIKILGEVR
jgi:hypothetical protein